VIHHFSIPVLEPAAAVRVFAALIYKRAYRLPGPLPGADMPSLGS
jgi:hypothetical protein